MSSTPLRFGILGAARIAPKALVEPVSKIYAESGSAVVTMVAARDRQRAEAFASDNNIGAVADDYQAVISSDEVDVVYNPLPMNLHAEWTIRALEAGKHVLCEKPFASNAAEAAEMVAAAERTGRVLGEAFHYRYHPYFERIVEVVSSGVLGTVEQLEAVFNVEIAKPDLRWSYETSGGALMDLGCYPVSWVRHIVGDEPEVISAEMEGDAAADPDRIDARTEAHLRFGSGIQARIETSMVDPFEAWVEVRGDRGTLRAENPLAPQANNLMTLTTDTGTTVATMDGGNTYEHMVRCFCDHVVHGLPFPTAGADAIANMATIDSIYQAAGRPLRGADQ